MEQYPIPQFIEEEGRIIFFLTFKQFFWLVGGGAVAIGMYYLLPFYLFVFGFFAVASIVIVLGFIKVNGQPSTRLFMNFIGFSFGSHSYEWAKKEFSSQSMPTVPPAKAAAVPAVAAPLAPATLPQPSKLRQMQTQVETKR